MKSFKEFIVESPEDEIAANLARGRDAHKAEYPDGDKHGDAVYAKYKADKAAKAAGAPSKDPHGDVAMAKSREGTTIKPTQTDPNMDPNEAAHQKKMAGHKANIDRIRSARENEKTSDQIGAMNPNERARYKRQVGYDLKAAQDKLVGVRATNKVNVGVANAVADVKQGLNNADIAGRRAEQTVSGAKWDAQVDSLRTTLKGSIARSEAASRVAELALSPQSPPKQSSNETIGSQYIFDPNKPPRDRSKDRVTMNPSYELIPGGRRRIQRPDAPARVEDNWMRDYIRGQGKKKPETPLKPRDPNSPKTDRALAGTRVHDPKLIDGHGYLYPKTPLKPRDPNSPIPRFGRKQSDNPINTKMSERIRKNIINRPRQ